jgi:hypothetical protein
LLKLQSRFISGERVFKKSLLKQTLDTFLPLLVGFQSGVNRQYFELLVTYLFNVALKAGSNSASTTLQLVQDRSSGSEGDLLRPSAVETPALHAA